MFETFIYSGELDDMRDFDLSRLNGVLNVCSRVSISDIGIHLWISTDRISIYNDVIDFDYLSEKFSYDGVIIRYSNNVLKFIIYSGDTNIYLSVKIGDILDV